MLKYEHSISLDSLNVFWVVKLGRRKVRGLSSYPVKRLGLYPVRKLNRGLCVKQWNKHSLNSWRRITCSNHKCSVRSFKIRSGLQMCASRLEKCSHLYVWLPQAHFERQRTLGCRGLVYQSHPICHRGSWIPRERPFRRIYSHARPFDKSRFRSKWKEECKWKDPSHTWHSRYYTFPWHLLKQQQGTQSKVLQKSISLESLAKSDKKLKVRALLP